MFLGKFFAYSFNNNEMRVTIKNIPIVPDNIFINISFDIPAKMRRQRVSIVCLNTFLDIDGFNAHTHTRTSMSGCITMQNA